MTIALNNRVTILEQKQVRVEDDVKAIKESNCDILDLIKINGERLTKYTNKVIEWKNETLVNINKK